MLLRLPSALAGGAPAPLTGLLTRELGGRRAAQALACAVIALAPVVTGASHLLSTTTFDFPVWVLPLWLLVRILRTVISGLGGSLPAGRPALGCSIPTWSPS